MIRIIKSILRKKTKKGAPNIPISYKLPSKTFKKFLCKKHLFNDVDWTNWPLVVDLFEQRFNKWYFEEMRGGDSSYLDLCSLCALIEVFSYYDSDLDWHAPRNYMEFLRKLDSKFRTKLCPPIVVTRLEKGEWREGELKDAADVFYAGVRCSLHHHGDLASYTGMSHSEKGNLIEVYAENGQSDCGRFTYQDLLIFDPDILKQKLREWLKEYCRELKADSKGGKACRFRKKFERDFCIQIP